MEKPGPLDELRKDSDTLVVLFHGAFKSPKTAASRLKDVKTVADAALIRPDVLAPQLPTHLFSFVDPESLAWRVVDMINERIACHAKEGTPIKHIVFVGYSFGGLLARMTYVAACGETEAERWIVRGIDGQVRPLFSNQKPPPIKSQAWAHQVRRVVLLAGMNRGWTVDFRITGLWRTALFAVLQKMCSTLEKLINLARWMRGAPKRAILGFTFRRGGRFISALRWQWLRMRTRDFGDEQGNKLGRATVIQLLGTKDDLVSPEDNIDLVTGADFIYLEMPDCGHENVVEMEVSSEKRPLADINDLRRYCRDMQHPHHGRAAIFALTLEGLAMDQRSFEKKLRQIALQPGDDAFTSGLDEQPKVHRAAVAGGESPGQTLPAKDVVFVIHGIRDLGHWTQKVAWRIKEYGHHAKRPFRTVTHTYGYFPMWPFLFPAERRRHVEWLVDQILQVLARHPEDSMHYCGHSNGTYLLARALEDYPFLKFTHVVFAGSVVRRDYPWKEMIESGQVAGVLNYVASADRVVGFFPKFFQAPWPWWRLNDLGGGGHDGFQDLKDLEGRESSFEESRALQFKYVQGGHGAAIGEDSWGDIANAIVHGKAGLRSRLYVGEQKGSVAAFSTIPLVVWLLILGILYLVFCLTIGAWPWPFGFRDGFSHWIKELKAWELCAWIRLVALWVEWRLLRFVLLRL